MTARPTRNRPAVPRLSLEAIPNRLCCGEPAVAVRQIPGKGSLPSSSVDSGSTAKRDDAEEAALRMHEAGHSRFCKQLFKD